MNHFIKKISLFSLLIATHSLYAAKLINESDSSLFLDAPQIDVLDYTVAHNKKSVNQISVQDLQDVNLPEHLKALCIMAKNNPMLSAVIMSDQKSCKKAKQSHSKDDQKEPEKEGSGHMDATNIGIPKIGKDPIYKKYVLDAQGLLNKNAHTIAHGLGYHVIQTQKAHIVVGLMQWLQKSPESYLYDIVFSGPICSKCHYLLTLLGYDKEVKVDEKGCQAKPFPWPMPDLAMQQLNYMVLNTGQPLKMTQTILQKMLGISETSYNQLKDELKKKDNQLNETHLRLTNKDNVIDEIRKELTNKNNLLEELRNKERELTDQLNQLKNQFKQSETQLKKELNNKEKELQNFKYPKKKYKGAALPKDLSGQNLSGYDFTGCQFTYTNLTDTNLTNVILVNTTCDYQKTFLDNFKKIDDGIGEDYSFKDNIVKQLTSITAIYPKLKNNVHKSQLLHIACSLAWSPIDAKNDELIRSVYWISTLLQLKSKLEKPYHKQLIFAMNGYSDDLYSVLWETEYPQDKITIEDQALHANFDRYLNDFTNGMTQYLCKSKDKNKVDLVKMYTKQIIQSIEGLKKAYNKVKNKDIQQEMKQIGHALSKSYQIQKMPLWHHYIFYQYRLLQLKKLVELGVKKDIYYDKLNY